MTHDKVTPEHLHRKSMVYVRQSTPDQVRNRESQRSQYGLADRARAMGWQTVEVIGEDPWEQGRLLPDNRSLAPWWPKTARMSSTDSRQLACMRLVTDCQ